VFEVSLEGLGASAQDIEALQRIRALIAGKTVAAQQEQEMRPSSSQAQSSQQHDAAPTHAAPDAVDFNIRQAERYLALLQSHIASAAPPQQAIPTSVAPAPVAATQAAPASQQHIWHTLQAMQAQQGQWDQPKAWQAHPPKQAPRQVNNVSRPPTKTRIGMAMGTKEDTKTAKGRGHNNHIPHNGGRREVFLLAPWDRRSPPHPSMPFGDQEEVGVGS
jgi:hypothetical protein